MIVDLPNTTTNELNKKITALREEGGAITLGRVLTLVIAPDSLDLVEDAIDAAVSASREHPCRIIVAVPDDRLATTLVWTASCGSAVTPAPVKWSC